MHGYLFITQTDFFLNLAQGLEEIRQYMISLYEKKAV